MYASHVICNQFLAKGNEEGVSISIMKALKLVYLAHAWNLGNGRGALISDSIQAWKYGPVIPSLYKEIKHYGKLAITSMIDLNSNGRIDQEEFEVKPEDQNLIEVVWNVYKDFSGLQLSTITHAEGSPWHKIYHEKGEYAIIPNTLIEEFYKAKVEAIA